MTNWLRLGKSGVSRQTASTEMTGKRKLLFRLPCLLIFFTTVMTTVGQQIPCHREYAMKVALLSGMAGKADPDFVSKALDFLEQEIQEKCPGDSANLADIEYLKGNLDLVTYDMAGARSHFRVARDLAITMTQLSRIDQNTGSAWFLDSEYDKAKRYFLHALAEQESLDAFMPARFLDLYDNLGSTCFEQGDMQGAWKWWNLSEQTVLKYFPSDSMKVSEALNNAALVSFGLKDWQRAVNDFRGALLLNPSQGKESARREVSIRKNLAIALMKNGQSHEAERVLDSLLSANNLPFLDRPVFRSEIYRLKAWIRYADGETTQSDSLLNIGREMIRELPAESVPGSAALTNFRILRDRACMHYLQTERDHQTPSGTISDDSLFGMLGKAFDAVNVFRNEITGIPEYILIHDSAEILLSRILDVGFTLSSTRPEILPVLLSIAGNYHQRSRRADALMKHRDGYPAGDPLIARWLQVNRKIYLEEKLALQLASTDQWQDPVREQRMFLLKNEYDSLAAIIHDHYPTDPGMTTQGSPGERLSSHEAILDYIVANRWIYLFIIRNDTIVLVRSERDPRLRELVKELKVALQTDDESSFEPLSHAVSGTLVHPALTWLKGITRLYIIPGRQLSGLPFECLREKPENGRLPRFLAERFTLSYHLSLDEITPDGRWDQQDEKDNTDHACDFLAFSPAFGEQQHLAELGNAEPEAREISEMFRASGCMAEVFAGEEADEATFLDKLSVGNIIHIATHSKLDPDHPRQSGLHFWKQSPVGSGDELLDGILEVGEVNGLRLSCELLTLSSCPLGRFDVKEARPYHDMRSTFLDAGAQRVLYSLWNISDKYTRRFMKDFYRSYLGGNTFPESLRSARLRMLNDPATASPYFWAAFVLMTK